MYVAAAVQLCKHFEKHAARPYAVKDSLQWNAFGGAGSAAAGTGVGSAAAAAAAVDEAAKAADKGDGKQAGDSAASGADSPIVRMLRRLRLLNHWQHRLPTFWVYFEDDLLLAVVAQTVALLGMLPDREDPSTHTHRSASPRAFC